MKILNIFILIINFTVLTGCIQTTSLLGPGVTIASTGNVLQAGFQYAANTALKQETGKDVLTHIKDKVDENNNKKKLYVKIKQLLENRIETTRKKLLSN